MTLNTMPACNWPRPSVGGRKEMHPVQVKYAAAKRCGRGITRKVRCSHDERRFCFGSKVRGGIVASCWAPS